MTVEERLIKMQEELDNMKMLLVLKNESDCINGSIGPRGKDGKDGKDGRDGIDGKTPIKGIDYFDGKDGKDGKDGINGRDGKDGKDGSSQSVLFQYIFYLSEDGFQPSRPVGGSFENPVPISLNWSTSPIQGQGTLFFSTRIFTSNGLPPEQPEWSIPKTTSNSTVLQFQWSSVLENPGNPTTHPENWSEVSSEQAVWMAMQTLQGSVWSDWMVMKIRGEDGVQGPKGDEGDSVIEMYAKNGSYATPPSLPAEERVKRFPQGFDAITPTITSLEYLWKIVGRINSNNELVGSWVGPIRITGEKGSSGEKGKQGVSIIPRGEFNNTTQYKGTETRVEAVVFENIWFVTRSDAGEIPIGTPPTNTDFWDESDETFNFIATGLFLAEVAYIKNLGVENLKTNDAGTRIEILKEENSLKFYVGNNTTPVLTMDTDVAEDPFGGGLNAGIRISAPGVGGINSVTTITTSGVFSNSGNTNIYPSTAGLGAVTSILGLAFGRDPSIPIDAGVAGMANVSSANNKNLRSVGGYFGTICHGGTLYLTEDLSNNETLNINGSISYVYSYLANGESATINLPNFDLNTGGWVGEFGIGLKRVYSLKILVLNGGANINVNAQGGREIIGSSGSSPTYVVTTPATGVGRVAQFEFIYTGSHWAVVKSAL